MLTFGELATFLEASAARVRPQLKAEVDRTLERAKTTAKDLIGHEIPEWAPLAARTIKEKTDLGFVGQVSATDPLLRRGDLRESYAVESEMLAYGVKGVLGSPDKIALYQEMGTVGAHPIPPRPVTSIALSRTLEKSEKEFGALAVTLLTPGVR